MKGLHKALSIMGFIALGLVTSLPAQQNNNHEAEMMLQEAQHLAAVEGDLEQAIAVCQKLVSSPNGNRSVVAKALLQMGQYYQKLGREEARKAFERVVNEFADQSDAVAEARLQLLAIQRENDTSGVTVRNAWSFHDPESNLPQSDRSGQPSPDGRYLSFTSWEYGNLAVRDLATGEYREITDEGTWDGLDQWAGKSIWSPDGKQIAYAWSNVDHWELRIVEFDGSGQRVLYPDENIHPEISKTIKPFTWSQDGKYILVSLAKDTGNQNQGRDIALISVADGTVRILKSFEYLSRSHNLSLSPDGRHIVYDRTSKGTGNIYCLSTDGGSEEILLVDHPADDKWPIWTPDGKSIVFISKRSGTYDAWILQIADGKPVGKPQLVKSNTGLMHPMGFTKGGSLYFGLRARATDIYTASIDPESGKLLVPPAKIPLDYEGQNTSPAWSPDGKYLAYTSARFKMGGQFVVVVRSMETGEEREFNPRNAAQDLRWSPDGRYLLSVSGNNRNGVSLINVQTGDATIPFRADVRHASWSPDGKKIYYHKYENNLKRFILEYDLETGRQRELVGEGVDWGGHGISPDGQKLAYISWDGNRQMLMLMPIAGGEARMLYCVPEGKYYANNKCPPVWTTDGRYVLFGIRIPEELWCVPVDGGEARKLLAMSGLRNVSVHPDGQRIAFTGGMNISEVWIMENFLPDANAGK